MVGFNVHFTVQIFRNLLKISGILFDSCVFIQVVGEFYPLFV